MATATPNYAAAATVTITLASLASDTTLLIGRQSTVVDNGTVDAIDCLVGGKFTTSTTAPTDQRQIEVWCFGTYDGTTYSASAGAADAALTLRATTKTLMRLITIIPTDATAAATYAWGPFSIAELYGGVLPQKWGIWVVQNTGQALHATGTNHELKYTPIKFEST